MNTTLVYLVLMYVIGIIVFHLWFAFREQPELGWFQNLFSAVGWPILVGIVLVQRFSVGTS